MATNRLPSTREEAWRWADLDALRAAAASGHSVAPTAASLDLDGPRLVFVDGVFAPEQSNPGRLVVEAPDLTTAHPLGAQASGTGWSLTLGAAE
ncbi:MAG: SufD family Fe-S cluster assembly protein, partial [Sphingomonadales bacterium]|nr:SufD family Fe-S cluster assembly protein [Sphingomonadales bacterium]